MCIAATKHVGSTTSKKGKHSKATQADNHHIDVLRVNLDTDLSWEDIGDESLQAVDDEHEGSAIIPKEPNLFLNTVGASTKGTRTTSKSVVGQRRVQKSHGTSSVFF